MQEKYCLGVPSDITIFRKLVENGTYIDKTMYLRRMLRGDYCYNLYLPHGWGKTLMCSLLKELFEGNRELFRGLDIYDKYDFKPHPVIYLDFRRLDVDGTFDTFMDSFWNLIYEEISRCGISLDEYSKSPQILMHAVIDEMYYSDQPRVVLLIDNYDSPLYRAIGKDFYEEMDDVLEDFYRTLKNFRGRFLLMTGVTKYLIRTLLGTGLYMIYTTDWFRYNGMFRVICYSCYSVFNQISVVYPIYLIVESQRIYVIRVDSKGLFIRPVAERGTLGRCNGKRIRVFPQIVADNREIDPCNGQFVRYGQGDWGNGSCRHGLVHRCGQRIRLVSVLIEGRKADRSVDSCRTKENPHVAAVHCILFRFDQRFFELDVDRIAPLRKYRSSCRIRRKCNRSIMVTVKNTLRTIVTFLVFFICSYAVNYTINGEAFVLSSVIFALITTSVLIIANKIFREKH